MAVVQFTKRQWLTLIVISIADFANAICVSLQAPFYPQEVRIIWGLFVGTRNNVIIIQIKSYLDSRREKERE